MLHAQLQTVEGGSVGGLSALNKRDRGLLKALIAKGHVPLDDVPRIRAVMRRSQVPMNHVLQDLGYVSERDLIMLRAEREQYTFVDVATLTPDPSVVELIPENIALQYRVLAFSQEGGKVQVACADPGDIATTDTISSVVRKRVEFLLASAGEISKKLGEYNDHYKSRRVERLLEGVRDQGSALAARIGLTVNLSSAAAESNQVIRTLNLLLLQALVRRASDIHLTPTSRHVLVQYRIDGILETVQQLPIAIAPELVNRIKILCELDIAERRLPQDGSFHIQVEGRDIDFRVATTPTLHGEKVVMRILDKQAALLGLENLGFTKDQYLALRQVLRSPNGIVLVAGPTGSGKSTTLYAALEALNTGTRNITTIEDPVEYQMDGVTQIQVDDEIGLSFSQILRSVLRQDPDVIMVGEIRDQNTTENAVRASLTGHLVLATVHSNDAVSAISRLVDMGTKPYLLAGSLRAVVSQRLVRGFCPKCRQLGPPDPALLALLPPQYRTLEQVAVPGGCVHCFDTGYRGRHTIAEILIVNDEIRAMIADGADRHDLDRAARKSGMVSIFEDGLRKVVAGATSLEEVLNVTETSQAPVVSVAPASAPAPRPDGVPPAPVMTDEDWAEDMEDLGFMKSGPKT